VAHRIGRRLFQLQIGGCIEVAAFTLGLGDPLVEIALVTPSAAKRMCEKPAPL
jgi:hypothetical protein